MDRRLEGTTDGRKKERLDETVGIRWNISGTCSKIDKDRKEEVMDDGLTQRNRAINPRRQTD